MKWEEYSVEELIKEIEEFDLNYVIRTMVKAEDLLRDLTNADFPTAGTPNWKFNQLANASKDMRNRKENIDRTFKKLFEAILNAQQDVQAEAEQLEEHRKKYPMKQQDKPNF